MSRGGSGLASAQGWEITAEPFYAFNCHCKLCRKAHGSAFGTYWFVRTEQFNWLSDTNTVRHYRSSHLLSRSFCGACGSVVPYPSEQSKQVVVPGGCHDDGKKSDCHVFVAHRAPWFEITGDLPRYDDYPEYTGFQRVEEEPKEPGPKGVVRGRCMCGKVKYHVKERLKIVHNCHCRRCRRARAAAHATNGFTSVDGVEFLQGEDNLTSYKLPDARYFTQVFCKTCGSKVPRLDCERRIAVIPLGGLDDDPGARPVDHIYVDYMARWYEISDGLPRFSEMPGRG